MKAALAIAVFSVAASLLTALMEGAKANAVATACYSADAYSNGEINYLTAWDTATTAAAAQWRQDMHLPAVSPSEIILVSDSVVCSRALTAFNAATQYPSGPATELYLIGVGSLYVASNPHFPSGEWTQRIVLDSAFNVLASYLK